MRESPELDGDVTSVAELLMPNRRVVHMQQPRHPYPSSLHRTQPSTRHVDTTQSMNRYVKGIDARKSIGADTTSATPVAATRVGMG
jgi:hypothetical protein